MTAEKYKQVKAIFLTACEKPVGEVAGFLEKECGGDEEVKREVESLLAEHRKEQKVIPEEPEGPMGGVSALLSRAGIAVGESAPEMGEPVEEKKKAGDGPAEHLRSDETHYLEEAHDQVSGSRSGIVDAGRFMAGTIVAGRYRIIEMLGRGGMGEVYRADDITLNQSVALKFLPALFGSDAKWLERFRNEVRLSRQVTHPNVCRVFDIGEFQGEQFISMEYVDGENLASLLRRIGRVPRDKAVQMARQLCAGLSAAHDRGVLHRDLKPANVMIDGRGAVRITDFGLAAPVDEMRAEGFGGMGRPPVRAGTPAYMSPEQLAGQTVTVRSDVYSLGLVLYEMFTGRRAFRADSLRAYQKLHSSEEPTPPSEILEDIDPIVERVILRCLEKDPKDRPASAMAVSAALPGGNPLREILAAGETPSPEVVAAAGEAHGAMRPSLAVMLLATALVCLIGFVWMAPHVFAVQRALDPPEQTLAGLDRAPSPAILTFKAQSLIKSLGYIEPPKDWAEGFDVNRGYYLHVEKDQLERNRIWQLARPRLGMVYFWYRQSPELLVPARPDGEAEERDPGAALPGMIKVRLDALGRLVELEANPRPSTHSIPAAPGSSAAEAMRSSGATQAAATQGAVDWKPLLEAAGIDLAKGNFQATRPRGALPVDSDVRAAWTGHFDDLQSVRSEAVRIEAAAYKGKVDYFAIIGNWMEEPQSEDQAQVKSAGQWNLMVQTVLIAGLLVAGCVLAWRNYRSGRGDRVGAMRMALAFFLLGAVAWVFRAHHVSDPTFEFLLFQRGMGTVLYLVSLMWIFYLALEPSVRRIWPETVISWSRLLAGKWFDPLVGRDVLAGAAVGVITTLLALLEYQLPQWINSEALPVPLPSITSVTMMLHATQNLGSLFSSAIESLYVGLILLLYLVLARMATRRRWMAAASFILLFAVATAHYNVDEPWRLGYENLLSLFVQGILAGVLLMLMTRNGLVAVIFCLLTRAFLMDFPVTWDLSAWYAGASLVGIVAVVVTLGAGFYAALGGRAPFTVASAK